MQQIYKSRMPLVSLTVISLSFSICLAPDAVAKQVAGPVEQIQPVITLSQLQPIHPPVIAPAPLAVSKNNLTAQKKRQPAQSNGKRKAASVDHFRQGLAFKAKGNINRALVEFLKTTQKNPRQINAFYEQALIFRQQGYLKLADSALEQALRIAKSVSKNPKIKPLNENDLTRIRLLLATVRLEQGNVGSAAEELSRSLGITLSVKQPAAEPASTPQEEDAAPTTILQSLHPIVEESREKSRAKTHPVEDKQTAAPPVEKAASTPGEAQSTDTPAAATTPQKETAADSTVAELIKEGLAGLKEHIFNPLSILGVPRISMEQENSTAPKKKEKRTRRSLWREPKRKQRPVESAKIETAKVDESSSDAKKQEKDTRKKRRSWWEKRLALSSSSEVKADEISVSEQKPEKNAEDTKTAQVKEEPVTVAVAIPEATKQETEKQEENKKDSSDPAFTSKAAALTFAKEDSTRAVNSDKEAPERVVNDEPAGLMEAGTFSLTIPPALTKRISLVASLLSAFNHEDQAKSKEPEKQIDPIEERLKYLAEHGTSSLKEGEAFMFSEESGEATLFMGNGEVIRRTIAIARGHEEVAKLRRPDILIPEELIYNLALMAKILPKEEQDKPKQTVGEQQESAPTLKMPAIIEKPHSFTDWLRGVLNL